MLINSPVDEVKRREAALKIIKSTVKTEGRDKLYDLTGLAGGFFLMKGDVGLLETYAGPAVFEDAVQTVGKIHMGGEKILPLTEPVQVYLQLYLPL